MDLRHEGTNTEHEAHTLEGMFRPFSFNVHSRSVHRLCEHGDVSTLNTAFDPDRPIVKFPSVVMSHVTASNRSCAGFCHPDVDPKFKSQLRWSRGDPKGVADGERPASAAGIVQAREVVTS